MGLDRPGAVGGRAVRAIFAPASASSPVSGLRHLAHSLCVGGDRLSAHGQTGVKLRHQTSLWVEFDGGDSSRSPPCRALHDVFFYPATRH